MHIWPNGLESARQFQHSLESGVRRCRARKAELQRQGKAQLACPRQPGIVGTNFDLVTGVRRLDADCVRSEGQSQVRLGGGVSTSGSDANAIGERLRIHVANTEP